MRVIRVCIGLYSWALYASARKRIEIDPETQALFEAKTPLLIGVWHGRLLLFAPFWRHCGPLPLSAIASPHADGMLFGGAAETLGLTLLYGTKGGEGGAKVMRAGLKALKNGQCLALPPDAPRGPRQVLGEGTAALAQLSGAPFVAISHSCARGWIADGQWDRPLYPRWFTRMTFRVSAPLYLDREGDRETVRQQIEALMNQQLWDLDAHYGQPKSEQSAVDRGI